MKTIILTLIVTAIFSSNSTAQNFTATKRFDPSGNYHPVQKPEEAPDKFLHFNIRFNRTRGRRASAVGEVRGLGAWFRFHATEIDENRIRFVTAPIRGVRYEFDGEFLGTGNFRDQWAGKGLLMLKGTLQKHVRGKQVLKFVSNYVYYPPH